METLTLRSLAARRGVVFDDALPNAWPLEQWFASVCDTPLNELTVFDLARSCRQEIELDAVVPYALAALRADPLAGELYDGELASAMMRLPDGYWNRHLLEHSAFVSVLEQAYEANEDERLATKIECFIAGHQQRLSHG